MAMMHKYRLRDKLSAILFIAVLLVAILGKVPAVSAGSITSIWTVESNMATGGNSQLFLAFKVTSAATAPTVSIALGSGVTSVGANTAALSPETSIGSTSCTTTFSYISGVTAMPATLSATGSGTTIQVTTTGNLSASTAYCVILGGSAAVVNSGTAGIYSVTVSDSSDSGSAYYITLSSPANSFSVTASVPQTFSLTVGAGPDSIPTLTYSTEQHSSGVTATVSSNAASGIALFAYDLYTGLHSGTTGSTVSSTSPNSSSIQTITGGSTGPGYLTTVTAQSVASGQALTIDPSFAGTITGTTSATGDGLSTTPAVIAYTTAPTNTAVAKLQESAIPGPITADATDYTDTITVVGAGSF
jgi:hypothetical protein